MPRTFSASTRSGRATRAGGRAARRSRRRLRGLGRHARALLGEDELRRAVAARDRDALARALLPWRGAGERRAGDEHVLAAGRPQPGVDLDADAGPPMPGEVVRLEAPL